MLGAIIGDMVGSQYDFNPIKTKKFNAFNPNNKMTDDSYLTIAVAKVLLKHYPIKYTQKELEKIQKDLTNEFVLTFKNHPFVGYGDLFVRWCLNPDRKPYNSFGNDSAMRISSVGWIANSEEEVKILSKTVSEITHNHKEGLKGAEAVALCVYLARKGYSKKEIRERMINDYYPEIKELDFETLVKTYRFEATCPGSVPQAIYCFLISHGLEDAIKNCIAIGGDCDTTGAMAGAIAEAYYQKNKVSKFEDMFMYYFIDKEYVNLILKLHKAINSKKFENKNY